MDAVCLGSSKKQDKLIFSRNRRKRQDIYDEKRRKNNDFQEKGRFKVKKTENLRLLPLKFDECLFGLTFTA